MDKFDSAVDEQFDSETTIVRYYEVRPGNVRELPQTMHYTATTRELKLRIPPGESKQSLLCPDGVHLKLELSSSVPLPNVHQCPVKPVGPFHRPETDSD